jgi:hypothetical protein
MYFNQLIVGLMMTGLYGGIGSLRLADVPYFVVYPEFSFL